MPAPTAPAPSSPQGVGVPPASPCGMWCGDGRRHREHTPNWRPRLNWLMARMMGSPVFGIFCNSIKAIAVYNSFSASPLLLRLHQPFLVRIVGFPICSRPWRASFRKAWKIEGKLCFGERNFGPLPLGGVGEAVGAGGWHIYRPLYVGALHIEALYIGALYRGPYIWGLYI